MKVETTITTTDGRKFTGELETIQTPARAHQRLLDQIERYCDSVDAPPGRARSLRRHVILGWIEFVQAEVDDLVATEVED